MNNKNQDSSSKAELAALTTIVSAAFLRSGEGRKLVSKFVPKISKTLSSLSDDISSKRLKDFDYENIKGIMKKNMLDKDSALRKNILNKKIRIHTNENSAITALIKMTELQENHMGILRRNFNNSFSDDLIHHLNNKFNMHESNQYEGLQKLIRHAVKKNDLTKVEDGTEILKLNEELIKEYVDINNLDIKGKTDDFFNEVIGAVRDTKEQSWSEYKRQYTTQDGKSNVFVDNMLSKFNYDSLGKKFNESSAEKFLNEMSHTKQITFNDYLENSDKFEDQIISIGDNSFSLKDIVKNAVDKDSRIGDIILDNKNLKFHNNEIIDMSEANDVKSTIGRKFAGTLPGKLIKMTDIISSKEPGTINFFDKGTTSPIIAGLAKEKNNIINNNYVKILDDFYLIRENGFLDKQDFGDDLYTVSSKHGSVPRLMNKMFGEGSERKATNKITKLFDINTSIESNFIDDMVRKDGFIGNIARKNFGGTRYNIIDKMFDINLANSNPISYRDNLLDMNYVMASVTNVPKTSTIKNLSSVVRNDHSKTILKALENEDLDEIINILQSNSKNIKNKDLSRLLNKATTDRESTLNILSINSTKLTQQKKVTKYDEMIKKEAFKEAIFSEVFNEKTGVKNHSAMNIRLKEAGLSGDEYNNARNLSNWMSLQFEAKIFNDDRMLKNKSSIEEANNAALSLINIQRKEDSLPINAAFAKDFNNDIAKIKEDYNDLTTRTIDRERSGVVKSADEKNNYVVMRKGYSSKQLVSDMIRDKNDKEKAKANLKRFGSQFIAGKEDPNNVTLYTLAPYFFTERLVDPFNKIGLGLSSENMGSTADMWQAIMLKRILPIATGLTALSYINDTTQQLTGTSMLGATAQGIGNVDLGLRKIADITHISNLLSGERGVDPITQYWFGDNYENSEDRKDYYENGYDEVRKGRWWAFGSAGEFRGGKVSYFEPNFVKRANSNWHDVSLYGSIDEKWAHSWLPTPTHPFAPINKMMDPYWLEKKHYWDRPYMETAPLFSQGTPWGAILNPTVGQIIKPVMKMHKDETGKSLIDPRTLISEQNAYIKAKAMDKNKQNLFTVGVNGVQNVKYIANGLANQNSAIVTFKMGNGRLLGVDYNGIGYQDSVQDASEVKSANYTQIDNSQTGTNESVGISFGKIKKEEDGILKKVSNFVQTTRVGMAIQGAYDTIIPGQGFSSSDIISQINNATMNKAKKGTIINENNLSDMPARLASQRAITSQDESDLLSSSSNYNFIEDALFSGKQLSGIYGFLGDVFIGDNNRKVRRANANAMTSWTSSFWDANIGGVGGGPMEIMRRFFPHADHSWTDLNPIRNTMPDWMPNRFKTGDPFTKVTKGEMRLPGAGYESIHHLRSDQYGRYGALDRMRILGDIAPWSDEYKLWRNIAQKEVTDPAGKKEIQAIKNRVTEQSKQHDFYEYKFLGTKTETNKVMINSVSNDSITDMNGITYNLAGLKMGKGEGLQGKLKAGMTVNVETLKDQADSGIKEAAIFSDGENLNQELIKKGEATKQDNDNLTPMGAIATTGSMAQIYGDITEAISHAPIPFVHNKILRVDTAIDSYKNERLYGSPYSTWDHPIKGFIEPAFQKAWGRGLLGQSIAVAGWAAAEYSYANSSKIQKMMNNYGLKYSETMIKSTGSILMNVLNPGAFAGSMMAAIPNGLMGDTEGLKGMLSASVFKSGVEKGIGRTGARLGAAAMLIGYGATRTKNPFESTAIFSAAGMALANQLKHENIGGKEGALIGAATGLVLSALRNPNFNKNMFDIYTPKNTKKRWDIDEYYDRLEYIKWKGLYEKAARKAKFLEHVDIKKIINANEYAREANQKKLDKLNKKLQDVSNSRMGQNSKSKLINNINSQIIKINTSSQTLRGGKYTKAAIAYKQAMDSTLYGLNRESTMVDIMRAIPKGDKDYFMQFMKEKDEKKRKEILKIVSPYERRALQIAWGNKRIDKIKDNKEYFKSHYMPGVFWAGWRPQIDLQNTKIKTIENEGMLLSDFGIYESQANEPDAILAPEVGEYDKGNSSALGLQAKLQSALSGTGLIGVKVSVSPSLSTNGIDVISQITNSAKITQYKIKQEMNNITGTRMFY